MPSNNKAHEKLCDDILLAVGSLPHVRIWKRKVGKAVPYQIIMKNLGLIRSGGDFHLRPIDFGIEGEADIQGLMAPSGRSLAIEVKTGGGRLSDSQIRWKNMFVKFGGLYIEARSVDHALSEVKRYLAIYASS